MSAVSLNFTLLDGKGKSSITKIRVPTGFTPAQYGECALAFGQLIADMAGGQITEISVSLPVDLSGATIRAFALASADIAQKAMFVVASTVTGLFSRFNIPTLVQANVVEGSDTLDTVDADVAAVVGILEDGINVSGTFVQPCDLRDNDLETVTEARQIFRKFN